MKKSILGLNILIGILIGALFCILNIVISLKTGLGFGGEQIVAVVGIIFLHIIKRKNVTNITLIQTTACGAFLAMFAVDSAIAACTIYGKEMLSLPVMCIFGIVSLSIGFIGAYYVSGYFIDKKKLVFPIGKATAETILSLTNSNKGNTLYLCIGIFVSLGINIPIYVLELIPDTLMLNGIEVPSFIGIAISPMLFGLGFLIGCRTSISMAFGAIVSIILWIIAEGADVQITYNQHLNSKWIMSLSVSIMILSSFIPIFNTNILNKLIHKRKKTEAKTILTSRDRRKIIITIMCLLISLLVLFYLITQNLHDTMIITSVLLPMLLLGVIFCSNSVGETGLSPITPLGIISFIVVGIFVKDFRSIMFAGAFICAVASAAVTMINSIKTAQMLEVDRRLILIVTTIGGLFGAIIGSITILAVSNIIGFGTEALPAPVSITWGAIVDSVSKGIVPRNINPLICLLGITIGLILKSFGASIICFGVGVMLSPSISIAIFLGGICRKLLEVCTKDVNAREMKIAKGELVMSGLIVGEGISIIIMLAKIMLLN